MPVQRIRCIEIAVHQVEFAHRKPAENPLELNMHAFRDIKRQPCNYATNYSFNEPETGYLNICSCMFALLFVPWPQSRK